MPYSSRVNRTYNSKRRRYLKKSAITKKQPMPQTPSILTKEVASLQKSVKTIQREMELKYFDVYSTSSSPVTGGAILSLNSMVQGTDDNQRLGREILMTSIQVRMKVQWLFANVLAPVNFRMMVVLDRQTDGSTIFPTGSSGVLDNTVITDLIIAPYNLNAQKRFKILFDNVYVRSPQVVSISTFATPTTTTTGYANVNEYIKVRIPCKYIVKFNSAAAGVSSIVTNAVWSILIADNNNGINTVTGYRTYYKDS